MTSYNTISGGENQVDLDIFTGRNEDACQAGWNDGQGEFVAGE